MRHYPRHRLINDASLISWRSPNGDRYQDRYGVELYLSLIDAQDQARQLAAPVEIIFGSEVAIVTLTDIEDIQQLVRDARMNIALARQGKLTDAST